ENRAATDAPAPNPAAMASSLDPFIAAIIAVARRAVNSPSRGLCPQRRELTGTKLFEPSQKRYLHDAQESHTPGPARRGREIQELGQVGAKRRDRYAQLYQCGRHHRR